MVKATQSAVLRVSTQSTAFATHAGENPTISDFSSPHAEANSGLNPVSARGTRQPENAHCYPKHCQAKVFTREQRIMHN